MISTEAVLQTPPQTWKQYTKTGDHWSIVTMEMNECRNAVQNWKADPEKVHEAVRELTHTAASLLSMRVELMLQACKKKNEKDK